MCLINCIISGSENSLVLFCCLFSNLLHLHMWFVMDKTCCSLLLREYKLCWSSSNGSTFLHFGPVPASTLSHSRVTVGLARGVCPAFTPTPANSRDTLVCQNHSSWHLFLMLSWNEHCRKKIKINVNSAVEGKCFIGEQSWISFSVPPHSECRLSQPYSLWTVQGERVSLQRPFYCDLCFLGRMKLLLYFSKNPLKYSVIHC